MLRNLWEHFEVYVANFSLLLMVGFLTLQIVARYFFQVGIATIWRSFPAFLSCILCIFPLASS